MKWQACAEPILTYFTDTFDWWYNVSSCAPSNSSSPFSVHRPCYIRHSPKTLENRVQGKLSVPCQVSSNVTSSQIRYCIPASRASVSFVGHTAHCGTERTESKSGMAILSSFPLREYWYYLVLSRFQYSCKRTQDNKRKNPEGCHSRVGAHFLSHGAMQPTEKTETLDACIKTIILIYIEVK